MRLNSLKITISPFWRWVLFLVLLPILELFCLLVVFERWWWFILLSMLVSGLFGVLIAWREGVHYWTELNRQLDRGEMPTLPVLHGVLIMSAAFLMIMPGLLTSLVGLLLLIPFTRFFVVSHLVLQFEAYRLRTRKGNADHSPEIIDV
jgi:UPF0716 protein FxsA